MSSKIDLNSITKASFQSQCNDNKCDLSLVKRKQIKDKLLIDAFKMLECAYNNVNDLNKEKQFIIQSLNSLLALCYISNINLNEFISVTLNEDNISNNQ